MRPLNPAPVDDADIRQCLNGLLQITQFERKKLTMSNQEFIDLQKKGGIVKELHGKLLDNEFRFIAPGKYLTREVHKLVQEHYPDRCRDHFLCRLRCKNGNNSGEWKHVVRRVLQQFGKLKKNGKIENVKRGVWRFR